MPIYTGEPTAPDESGANEPTGQCSVCGEPAVAYWKGVDTIEVCTECAVEKLPRLIAEAIVQNTTPDDSRVHRLWQNAEVAFYSALEAYE